MFKKLLSGGNHTCNLYTDFCICHKKNFHVDLIIVKSTKETQSNPKEMDKCYPTTAFKGNHTFNSHTEFSFVMKRISFLINAKSTKSPLLFKELDAQFEFRKYVLCFFYVKILQDLYYT